MLSLILASVLVITPTAPPLTPAQAAAVLRGSHSPADMTDYRAAPQSPYPPSPVVVERRVEEAQPTTVMRPLNCCGQYVIPAPVPTINVVVTKP